MFDGFRPIIDGLHYIYFNIRATFDDLLYFLRRMRLFRGRVFSSALYAGGLAFLAHVALRFIPADLFATSIVQTVVAYLAIGAGVIFVLTHHRRDGRALTQVQEEMFLILAFGLFWFSLLVALRAYRTRTPPGSGNLIDAVARALPTGPPPADYTRGYSRYGQGHGHGHVQGQGHGYERGDGHGHYRNRHDAYPGERYADYTGTGSEGYTGCFPGEMCVEEEAWGY